jgi:hypothetical protein
MRGLQARFNKRNERLTNTFYKKIKIKKNDFKKKMTWHNMIRYEIHSNFEKLNHIALHQFIKVFL